MSDTILSESEPVETSSPLVLRFLLSLFQRKKNVSGAAKITDLELRRALRTFARTHNTRTPEDELLESWRVLRKLSQDEFTRGCRRYLEDGSTFFPTPSEIKRLALDSARYESPAFYEDPLEDEPRVPFDRAAFRARLRELSGIDLDNPPPVYNEAK